MSAAAKKPFPVVAGEQEVEQLNDACDPDSEEALSKLTLYVGLSLRL